MVIPTGYSISAATPGPPSPERPIVPVPAITVVTWAGVIEDAVGSAEWDSERPGTAGDDSGTLAAGGAAHADASNHTMTMPTHWRRRAAAVAAWRAAAGRDSDDIASTKGLHSRRVGLPIAECRPRRVPPSRFRSSRRGGRPVRVQRHPVRATAYHRGDARRLEADHTHARQIRTPALVAADRLADVPRCRPGRRSERLGLDLDMGPPAGDLRPVGPADLRGLERVGCPRADHASCPTRADGRGEHVPEPGRHDQARYDAGPRLRRSGDPRHRRRMVRTRTRRVRDRVRREPRRAHRMAG